MDIDQLVPTTSDYLKASDLNGQHYTLTITRFETGVKMQNDDIKTILHFQEAEKGLVLNRTNAQLIADIHGRDAVQWSGKQITLAAEMVEFAGKRVPAIRVQAGGMAAAAPMQQPVPQPVQQPVQGVVGQAQPVQQQQPMSQIIGEEIPF